MAKNNSITVQNIKIAITSINNEDYISLTDMVKAKDDDSRAADIIKNWLRNRGTLEFLGTWESIYNPDFKVVEFDHFGLFYYLCTQQYFNRIKIVPVFFKYFSSCHNINLIRLRLA